MAIQNIYRKKLRNLFVSKFLIVFRISKYQNRIKNSFRRYSSSK